MTKTRLAIVALTAASLGGCGASLPSLTTGSLFGGGAKPADPQVSQNDPLARAMDVGATAARAIKCGYNFDPAKLKSQYLAAETAGNPADAEKLGEVYDKAFNGVSKAIATKEGDYCTAEKTAKIKDALRRHLAGDYTPSPPEPPEDGGLFSGWSSGGSGSTEGVNSKGVFE